MADPKFVTDAREQLGASLAALRMAAGFTQESFAPHTLYGRSTVANVETGRQRVQREFWERCDTVLGTGGVLADEHDRIERMRNEHVRGLALAAPGSHRSSADLDVLDIDALRLPAAEVLRRSPVITLPAGRFFDACDLDVRVFPAMDDGRVLIQVPPNYATDPFIRRSRRGLIIGATSKADGDRLYGIDSRQARRRLAAGSHVRLMIPKSYLLDSVALGVLWAVTAFDEALLDDDRQIEESRRHLERFEGLPRSAASRSSVGDLAAVSAMWLGSDFCARHILRHASDVTDIPAFWTREQRGEEASSWLLFAHKYQYLDRLAQMFPAGMSRTFCVPEDSVKASPAAERALMLLVMALMESFGIRCQLATEPEYAAVDGFVLDGARRAIIANWIGGDGIWSVDVTSSRPIVREYADANDHVAARPLVASTTPVQRLQGFAAYLGLDWHAMTGRCAQLAEYGLAGLANPRSRLLSLAGVERACHYISSLARATR